MLARTTSVVAVIGCAILSTSAETASALPLPSVAGLVFHLDADNPTSVTFDGGNRVSQWNDQSASNNHALSSGANRPLFVANSWTGGVGLSRDVIRFAQATDEVMITQSNSPFSGNGFGITVFSVMKLNNSPGTFSSVVSQSPGTSHQGMGFVVGADQGGVAFTDTWRPYGRKAGAAVPVAGNGQIITWVVPSWLNNPTTAQVYYNGVPQTMSTYGFADGTPTLTANPFRIGNWDQTRPADDMVLRGDIGEILIYNGAVSNADRLAIEAYLTAKWFTAEAAPVPEPSSGALLVTGVGLALIRRRRGRN